MLTVTQNRHGVRSLSYSKNELHGPTLSSARGFIIDAWAGT